MAETYCGKSCAACPERSNLKCPGCKHGPGKAYTGECGITRCCLSRGFSACEECTTASTCFQWKHRDAVPAERIRRRESDAAAEFARAQENELLAKWLWMLFWVVIASIAAGFVSLFAESLPELKMLDELISAAFSVGYGLILIKMATASYCFQVSGICKIIAAVFTLGEALLGDSGLAVLVGVVALIPSFVAEYQEFIGYSEITEEVDEDLSARWRTLWYWSLGSLFALGAGMILSLFGAALGAFLVLAAAIATLIVQIVKIIFLYKTAQLFRSACY